MYIGPRGMSLAASMQVRTKQPLLARRMFVGKLFCGEFPVNRCTSLEERFVHGNPTLASQGAFCHSAAACPVDEMGFSLGQVLPLSASGKPFAPKGPCFAPTGDKHGVLRCLVGKGVFSPVPNGNLLCAPLSFPHSKQGPSNVQGAWHFAHVQECACARIHGVGDSCQLAKGQIPHGDLH